MQFVSEIIISYHLLDLSESSIDALLGRVQHGRSWGHNGAHAVRPGGGRGPGAQRHRAVTKIQEIPSKHLHMTRIHTTRSDIARRDTDSG